DVESHRAADDSVVAVPITLNRTRAVERRIACECGGDRINRRARSHNHRPTVGAVREIEYAALNVESAVIVEDGVVVEISVAVGVNATGFTQRAIVVESECVAKTAAGEIAVGPGIPQTVITNLRIR